IFNVVQFFGCAGGLRLSERIGRKWVQVMAYVIYGSCTLGMYYKTDTYEGLLLLRAISGLGAIIHPMLNTIAADLAPFKQRGIWLSLSYGMMLLGGILSGILIIYLSQDNNYVFEVGCKICGAGFFFAALLTCFWKESAPLVVARHQRTEMKIKISQEKLQEKPFLPTVARLFTNRRFVFINISSLSPSLPLSYARLFTNRRFVLFTNRRFVFIMISYVLAVGTYAINGDTNSAWLYAVGGFNGTIPSGRQLQTRQQGIQTIALSVTGAVNTLFLGKYFSKGIGEKNVITFLGLIPMLMGTLIRVPFSAPANPYINLVALCLSNWFVYI
ncbi:major facilitator superfamily protein, partial [Kipferlia bialata]